MSAAWLWLRALFARVGSDPYYASYERSLSNIKNAVDQLQVGCGCRRCPTAALRLLPTTCHPASHMPSLKPPPLPRPTARRPQAARAARAQAWAAIKARFLATFVTAYAVVLGYAAYVNQQPEGTYTPRQQAVRVAPAFVAPVAAWLAHRLLGCLQVRRRVAGGRGVFSGAGGGAWGRVRRKHPAPCKAHCHSSAQVHLTALSAPPLLAQKLLDRWSAARIIKLEVKLRKQVRRSCVGPCLCA